MRAVEEYEVASDDPIRTVLDGQCGFLPDPSGPCGGPGDWAVLWPNDDPIQWFLTCEEHLREGVQPEDRTSIVLNVAELLIVGMTRYAEVDRAGDVEVEAEETAL